MAEIWQEKWKKSGRQGKMSTGLVTVAAATELAYGDGWDGNGHVWSELLCLNNKLYIFSQKG